MPAALFLVLLAFSASPWASPPLALLLGLGFALASPHPDAARAKGASKWLLQASVVGLGFGMDLRQVLAAGASGLVYTGAGIGLTLAAGLGLARLLGVKEKVGALVSVGTAVCGGSAIAAVGPILDADPEEMSVSLGTVFLLNSAALLLFPSVGAALGLAPERFGLWAALAIHDTSSVVGACAKYGGAALAVGTTVKLARALWIVPLSLGAAALRRSSAPVAWPWFILFFALAAGAATALPSPLWALAAAAAKGGLRATLFLIGSGLSVAALRKVGPRPLLLGVLLWAAAAGSSLAFVLAG
jgi:uncharacterized integral membrane protein (TIGR00698 family)